MRAKSLSFSYEARFVIIFPIEASFNFYSTETMPDFLKTTEFSNCMKTTLEMFSRIWRDTTFPSSLGKSGGFTFKKRFTQRKLICTRIFHPICILQ